MLAENKFSRYLIYAIGEIILVVIGILIALQINNLNEEKKDNIQERVILQGIINEMLDNKNELIDVVDTQQKAIKSGYDILGLFSKNLDAIDAKKIDSLLTYFEFNRTFNGNLGMLKSAISSGQVNKIKNIELKRLLLSYEPLVTDLNEEYLNISNLKIQTLWPITDKFIPGTTRWSLHYPKLKKSHFNDDYKGLFSVKEFESVITYITAFREEVNTEELNLIMVTDEILKLLNEDLE